MSRRMKTGRCNELTVLSLFTGCGGLDLGLESAGFNIRLCVEINEDARRTLRINRPNWRLTEPGDIHKLDPKDLLQQTGLPRKEVALLAGGPPCQPFSKSAYWFNGDSRRLDDPRANTLHAYLHVVETVLPKVLLLENVKGLAFNGKDQGLQLLRKEIAAVNRRKGTKYELQVIHLNAADYGVPQMRERVFILASIDGRTIDLPAQTHGDSKNLQPYHTAWDAIGDLDTESYSPDLKPSGRWGDLLQSIPEGQNYLWHTPKNKVNGGEPLFGWRTRYWSFLLKLTKSQPSWTLQADPGPATGPFHWKGRLLSIEEMSRLQTFPEGYRIEGNFRSARRQVGNAVPSAIGELLGLEIRRQLLGERVRRNLRLIPAHRSDCPPPELPASVPKRYLKLRAAHNDHPGPGFGPGAQRRDMEQISAYRYLRPHQINHG